MSDSELIALNGLCKELYESRDAASRTRAEQNLAELSESPECLRRCMLLLEQGDLPYGPLVASNTLMKLLSSKTGMTTDQKLELSRYILTMLGSRCPNLPTFVVTSLCQLFARITKQEWTYVAPGGGEGCSFPFREPIQAIMKTVDVANIPESMLALQILSLLVTDMNTHAGMDSINKHRKNMSQFRDAYLLEIFQMTVSFLEGNAATPATVPQHTLPLVQSVLELCLNCMLFDFIGSLADETSEDNYNVQVPTIWRSAFTDGTVISLMFTLYQKLPQSSTEKILHIIVQLASVRRTLFGSAERQCYLEKLVVGVKMVIENPNKLNEQAAFHEFSRLVARLKTNYQLLELIKVQEYPQMMRLLAEFTVQSLRIMEFSANSTYYLLTFWQRMVTSVPYVKTNDEHLLNVYCPEIVTAFIESRLDNVERVVRDGVDDPLEDQGSTLQVMEHLAIICRCVYEKTCLLLANKFDENAQIMQASADGDLRGRVARGRLIWLVTLIGTAVFGKTAVANNDEHDKMDGDLVARCLKFMRLNDANLIFPVTLNSDPGNGSVRLEVAFIHLLENFRRAYIMDQVSRTSHVYEKLTSEVGVADETEMLSVIIQKILTNFKFWALNDNILSLSLALFKDLSLGYSAVRKLFRLDEVQLLLNNHTAEHFAFLGPSVDFSTMKHRTVFYEALTRLLTIDLNDDDEVFKRFMAPLTETVKNVCKVMDGSSSGVDVDQLRRVIVGLLRDLRGIATACTTKNVFQILFDWLYPDMFNIMHRCVEEWADRPEVTCPLFRLLSELCQNRQQRLKFEMNSCSAVLLFKEASKIITTYGNRILVLPDVEKEHAYKQRFKNTGIIFSCLKSALVGAYVPFGVFRLYGDSCLQDVLNMFIKLFQRIPESDFHSYTKISQSYYCLLENVVHDNMPFMSNLDPEVFAAVLRSIQTGIVALDATVITSACSALDGVLNYLFKRLTRTGPVVVNVGSEPEGENCLIAVKNHPQIMSELLTSMLSSLMFSEVKCQWSISRPLLGLILLQEEVFTSFKEEMVRRQPVERAQAFQNLFTNLMEGIERNLNVKNKDTFTQNLAKFRRDLSETCKGVEATTTSTNNNEMS